jgi:hypothetical protein
LQKPNPGLGGVVKLLEMLDYFILLWMDQLLNYTSLRGDWENQMEEDLIRLTHHTKAAG